MINWMKYRYLYLALSAMVIVPGVISLFLYGLKLSVDFTGGSILKLDNINLSDYSRSILEPYKLEVISKNNDSAVIRLENISQTKADEIVESLKVENKDVKVSSFETQGPALGRETIKKTIYAVLFASVLLLVHISRAFKQLKYGVCAILAMLHDSLVLLGLFSILGHFANIQTDLLFVTAALTILSFSVHDTIVVYDRIRELQRKRVNESIFDLANQAVSETMIRSLNNSLTIIFMLLALVLLGGETTRTFALALLIGTISGSYSSPFTAVPLLVIWDDIKNKKR